VKRILVLPILCALVASASADPEQAKARYKEGLVHYNVREYGDAVAKFKEAYKLDPNPAYLYNIAQAYRLAQDCADAAAFYKTFLRDSAASTANRDKAQRFAAEMDQCVADGKSVDLDPPVTADPVTDPVPDPVPEPVTEPVTEPVADPVTEPGPVREPAPPPVRRRSGSPALRYGGLATSAAGLIAVGTGVYFGLQARGASDDVERGLETSGGIWSDELEAMEQDAQRDEKVGLALTIGGAVATVGGGVLWYLGRDRGERSAPPVAVTPRRGGATVSWTTDF